MNNPDIAVTASPVKVYEPPKPFKVDWSRIIDNEDLDDAIDYFFGQCLFTRDEIKRGVEVVRQFPWERRLDIQRIVKFRLHLRGLFLTIASRKTMKTWTKSGELLFEGIREQGRYIQLGALKQLRADYNLRRILFMLNQLVALDTGSNQPDAVKVLSRDENGASLGNGTYFENLTQKITDLKQVTTSALFYDEFPDLPEEYKMSLLGAAIPATQGDPEEFEELMSGGIIDCIGTCNGEDAAWNLMFPTLAERNKYAIAPWEPDELRTPENGLKIWNRGRLYLILWYYFADPAKCPGTPWYKNETAKYPGKLKSQWEQYYEIWPVTTTGLEVTPEFTEPVHCRPYAEVKNQYQPDLALVVGWDIGGQNQCCTITQNNYSGRRINMFWQELELDMDVETFTRKCMEIIAVEFPMATVIHVGDPKTLASPTGTTMGTFSEVMQRAGVVCIPAPVVLIKVKVQLVKRQLATYIGYNASRVLIAYDTCPMLVAALRGGYRYNSTRTAPIKDGKYDHCIDSWAFTLLYHTYLYGDYEQGGYEQEEKPRRGPPYFQDREEPEEMGGESAW
jgi:hypothetical protein